MTHTLEVLNSSGHLTLTWNPSDPNEVQKAKEEVEQLRAAGYSFFAVIEDQDAVEAGNGTLLVHRIAAPAVTPVVPKHESPSKTPSKGQRTIAMRPMAGG